MTRIQFLASQIWLNFKFSLFEISQNQNLNHFESLFITKTQFLVSKIWQKFNFSPLESGPNKNLAHFEDDKGTNFNKIKIRQSNLGQNRKFDNYKKGQTRFVALYVL